MNMRLVVENWDENHIKGYAEADISRTPLTVEYEGCWQLASQLYPRAIVNLVDIPAHDDNILRPAYFILEPDYLIDITTICQCVKPAGITPLYYLLSKFMPREDSLAIQLGQAANQFLDDCINRSPDFQHSMQKTFKDYPLKYCTLEAVDRNYFEQCRTQHENIRQTVERYFPLHTIAQLEPAFVCDTLGLQGRFDLLSSDQQSIWELKSGKHDEFHKTYRTEHAWQMLLYREMLHYCLGMPKDTIQTRLLYSRYPEVYTILADTSSIKQALNIRNGIVHIDRLLREDCKSFLMSLTEDDFNPNHNTGKLYNNFQRPRILSFLQTLHSASPLELEYFCTMVSFLEREQLMAKVGDERPDSERAFARSWLSDTETKRVNGNIITDLQLKPIFDAQGLLTQLESIPKEETTANFREGDSVILYERNQEGDLITNRQNIRCQIESITPHRILLRLAFPQRVPSFPNPHSLYAIEPSHNDSLFASQYRGLYALLSCPEERRETLLGKRMPSEQHLYLLVGPPGSGKTSITLRRMVEAYLIAEPSENILLMAYTNRAVDEICQTLTSMSPAPSYIRIGQELTCAPEFRPRLMRNVIDRCNNRSQVLERLKPARVFCATVASLSGLPEIFRLKHFGLAILDEASQVLEPQILPILCATTPDGRPGIARFVMIGDHKQLPAVVVQPPSQSAVVSPLLHKVGLLDCRESLFQRLHRMATEGERTSLIGMLDKQGRMHEKISRFVSQHYYGGLLSVVPLPHQVCTKIWERHDTESSLQQYIATHRMGAIDVHSSLAKLRNPKTNTEEAALVASIVNEVYRLQLMNGKSWEPRSQLGIIVPFRGQIAVISHALSQQEIPGWKEITIDTVERFQGSQRDHIIFSTVVRHPALLATLSNPAMCDGTLLDRKLNVAISRSRLQFILVGDLNLLSEAADYRALIEYIGRKSCFFE